MHEGCALPLACVGRMNVVFIVWLVVCEWCGSDLQAISMDTGGGPKLCSYAFPSARWVLNI